MLLLFLLKFLISCRRILFLRQYLQIHLKNIKKTKNIKNNKRKFYKKYCVYNIKDNNLLNKSLLNSNSFNIKKSINKELVVLFKENINKNLTTNKLLILTLSYI